MLLRELENLTDEEKIEYFDSLLDYAKNLQQKNAEFLILKHKLKADNNKYLKEQEKLLERELDKKVNAKMAVWKRQKVKELDKEGGRKIYLDTVKKIKDERWTFEKEKARYRAEIIKQMAEAQEEEHPILKLDSRQWKSREKIYPLLVKDPHRTNKSIALELKTSEMTVEQARNELTASGQVLQNKIGFVKDMVVNSANIVSKSQEVLLKRLAENPDTIANKDLISAMKNGAALYSLMVGEATDNNGGMRIKEEDQKLLDEVLDSQLDFDEEAEIEIEEEKK